MFWNEEGPFDYGPTIRRVEEILQEKHGKELYYRNLNEYEECHWCDLVANIRDADKIADIIADPEKSRDYQANDVAQLQVLAWRLRNKK
jgi:hypothetical protein